MRLFIEKIGLPLLKRKYTNRKLFDNSEYLIETLQTKLNLQISVVSKEKQMALLLFLAKQEALDEWASVTIQALCRGKLGRNIAKKRKIDSLVIIKGTNTNVADIQLIYLF